MIENVEHLSHAHTIQTLPETRIADKVPEAAVFHPALAAELVLLCLEGSPAMADQVAAGEHVTPVGAMSHPGSQGACPAAWARSRQAGAWPSLVPRRITPRQKTNNRFQDELIAALGLSDAFAETVRLKK